MSRGGGTLVSKSKLVRWLALGLILPLLVSSCAGMAKQTTKVNYYPDCYDPIAKVREEHKDFVKNVAGGMIAGAVLGAIAGAAIGAATGGARGAAIGAAVGGGAGLAAGGLLAYSQAKKKQFKNDQARRASISKDIDDDAAAMDSIALAGTMASKCYKEQFDLARAEFLAGRMSKVEFTARTQEIADGLKEIAQLMGKSYDEGDKRLAQYKAAIDEEAKKDGKPVQDKLTARDKNGPAQPATEPEDQPKPKKTAKKVPEGAQQIQPAQPQADTVAQQTPVAESVEGNYMRADYAEQSKVNLKTAQSTNQEIDSYIRQTAESDGVKLKTTSS